jgi:hypothetical protein
MIYDGQPPYQPPAAMDSSKHDHSDPLDAEITHHP